MGPLTVKTPSPLPSDLEQFISGGGDKGIILFSLGTLGDAVLKKHQLDMLAEVFGRLEQRIIWRLNGVLIQYKNSRLRFILRSHEFYSDLDDSDVRSETCAVDCVFYIRAFRGVCSR